MQFKPWILLGAILISIGSVSLPASADTSASFRILTWNVQGGVGTDGIYDVNRIANTIAAQNPDAVCLNESNETIGNNLQSMLASKTGASWSVYTIGGNTILSRIGLKNKQYQLFQNQAANTTREMVLADLDQNSTSVRMVCTHLENAD